MYCTVHIGTIGVLVFCLFLYLMGPVSWDIKSPNKEPSKIKTCNACLEVMSIYLGIRKVDHFSSIRFLVLQNLHVIEMCIVGDKIGCVTEMLEHPVLIEGLERLWRSFFSGWSCPLLLQYVSHLFLFYGRILHVFSLGFVPVLLGYGSRLGCACHFAVIKWVIEYYEYRLPCGKLT